MNDKDQVMENTDITNNYYEYSSKKRTKPRLQLDPENFAVKPSKSH